MKEQWEELRDLAARQYEEDAKEGGGKCLTTPFVQADSIDLSPFSLTPEQEASIQNAANEYVSWVAKNGAASPLDEAFLYRRIERICEGRSRFTLAQITDVVRAALHQSARQHIQDKKNKEVRVMLDNAGMYSRPNIVDRIINAASLHAHETGKSPSVIYLGEKEVGELLAYAQKLSASMGGPGEKIEDRVCGFDLVRVKKESYFAVH